MAERRNRDGSNSADSPRLSRRSFMQSAIATASVIAAPLADAQAPARSIPMPTPPAMPPFVPPQPVSLRINGKQYELSLEPRTTLLDTLRANLDLSAVPTSMPPP